MRDSNWMNDVKLASASALTTTLFAIFVPCSPLWAADIMFTSAGGGAVSGENGDGEQQIASGIVQLKLDDGTIVSITGPARYSLSADGQLSIASGGFTASAPASGSPQPIIAGNGSQMTLKPGSSANGKIATDGSFSGFALSGSIQVASNGSSRNFPAGRAFRSGNGSGPSSAITAGVQPNRSGGQTPLQQIQQAQRNATQFLANASQTTPTSLGFAGVAQTQPFVPGTLQAATTPAQLQALVQAQTGQINPALALQLITDILAALQSTGGLGSYTGLTPAQIQALLLNLQTFGVPSGISQFQLEQFLRALGNAGFAVTGIAGQGPNFGSLADLLALVSSGGMIPAGDPTIQALIDLLFANAFPPGLDPDELARLFRLAGYTVPPGFGGGTGGTPTPSPTPTPTPPPVLTGSDGVRPDDSRSDINIAFAKITETGGDSPVTLIFDAGEFVGYRLRSGFEIKFDNRDEVEMGGDQGIIGWSRLAGGSKVLGGTRGPNSGDHFVYAVPMANRPTGGLVTYDLIGATSPTVRDDSVAAGSFDGTLAVSFSTGNILLGMDATVIISNDIYNILTAGGLTAPSIQVGSTGRFSGEVDLPNGVGIACNQGDCRFIFNGFLAGEGASHAGFAYTIRDDRGNNVTKWIDGSAAFVKTANSGDTPNPITKTFRGVQINDSFAQPVAGNFGSLITATRNFRTRGENAADEGGAFRIEDLAGASPTNKTDVTEVRVNAGVGSAFRNIGTARNADNGALGDAIGWTRWTDGEFDNLNGGKRVLSGSESIHYIWGGNPTGTLPSGRAEYAVGGGTRPTRVDGIGDPGTFEGEIAIDFASMKIGWDTIIGMGNDRFNFLSEGGLESLSIDFNNTFQGEGIVVSELGRCTGCTGTANGFLTGEEGRYVGFSYEIGTTDFGAIHGVAGFERADLADAPEEITRNEQAIATAGRFSAEVQSRVQTTGFTDGQLSSYRGLANFEGTRDTAQILDFGSAGDGIVNWSRWANGLATLTSASGGGTFDFPANGGQHFIYGSPATNLPGSGTISYELAGFTSPTSSDGSLDPGSFSGQLAVAFGATPQVGLDFNIGIGGTDYLLSTAGGAADPSNGGLGVTLNGGSGTNFGFASILNMDANGSLCADGCRATINGFLAGDGASHAGVSYSFVNKSGNNNLTVNGTAAFGAAGAASSSLAGNSATSGLSNEWAGWTTMTGNRTLSMNGGAAFNPSLINGIGRVDREIISALRERLGSNFSFK
ncbi:hypothetical protein A8B75_17500 [Sphingomonadales bacterium EhC05]|nr:hypothetical protein A8B75_17500 [Sphingomonadales bacterium EhC05]